MSGPDFGLEQGKVMLVVSSLYGMKSSWVDFTDLISEHLHDLGHIPQVSDPGFWIIPSFEPSWFM